jgi:hypothetical protein
MPVAVNTAMIAASRRAANVLPRVIDLAIGEHTGGPVFLAADGRWLARHGVGRMVRKTARRLRGNPR